MSVLYIAGKRVFRTYMRFCDHRTHEQTLEWAEQAERDGMDHVYGITGKSVFFEAEGFDVVKDMLPEPMHLIDAGFTKNTCTFHAGTAHQTRPGYRRAPTGNLSKEIR